MRARVQFRLPDGNKVVLGHGDVIGRVWSAGLQIEDPRISEAHALVSLRGDQLLLLALRGRLQLGGKVVSELVLTPGQVVFLTPDHPLQVVGVDLPSEGLALQAPGMPPQLLAGTCSVFSRPTASVGSPGHRDAVAHVWFGARDWWIQPVGGAAQVIRAGDAHVLDGVEFVAVTVGTSNGSAGTVTDGGLADPLHIVANFDTVHINRRGEPPVVLDGLGARLLSELVAFGGPVAWRTLAAELWDDDSDEHRLRKRLDVAMVRLRRRLAAARIRTNLVRATGRGMYELLVEPADRVEDRT